MTAMRGRCDTPDLSHISGDLSQFSINDLPDLIQPHRVNVFSKRTTSTPKLTPETRLHASSSVLSLLHLTKVTAKVTAKVRSRSRSRVPLKVVNMNSEYWTDKANPKVRRLFGCNHDNSGICNQDDSGISMSSCRSDGTLGGSQFSETSSRRPRSMMLDITSLQTPSLPMLEFCEKTEDQEGVTTHGHRMFQQYRGQLKLCVYLNSGLITIHMIQGRNFTSSSSSHCNSYVRLSLSPDPLRRTKCKTSVIRETNNPVIDEKISFELLPDDLHKRLMVSVWNRDPNQGSSELLGCMSFGVQNIVEDKTVINGWFFLLSEKVGKRKHLQSQNKRRSTSGNHSNEHTSQSESCISLATSSSANQTSASESSVTTTTERTCGSLEEVHIRRGISGFGISLTGGSPAQVYKVEPGSPADLTGLRSGGQILQISGQDVSRATANTVARIFRFSESEVTLQVHHCTAPLCSMDFPSSKSPLRDSHSSGDNSRMT